MPADSPTLTDMVDTRTSEIAQQAVANAKERGITGPMTYPVSTPWRGYYLGDTDNWYYATNGMQHSTTGSVTVYPPETPGGAWRYETSTQVEYRDQYNWDGSKSVTIKGFEVTDEQLAELHRAGLAREYTMYGTSSTRTSSGEIP